MAKNSANKDDIKIGLRMKEARLNAGLTQNDIAKYFKIFSQQIQKLELGHNRISAKSLFLLSKLFSRPMDWFTVDLEEQTVENTSNNNFQENQFTMRIMKKLKHINDEMVRIKLSGLLL